MGEALPEELQDTLQNVQIVALGEKKRRARVVVANAVTAAMAEGAAPIPIADAIMLVPTQISMFAGITVVFGFDFSKSIIAGLLSSTLGAGGATILGKTVASNLLKLIPGAGSIAGGAISAGTAAVLTASLGEAYINLLELVFKGELSMNDLNSKKGKEKMYKLFKEQLSMSSAFESNKGK
ncbi:YcjF family protein [Streptococcus parauberis]|uniref:YcjF family protein n=1 Tax=Streptococcus parauberis TaxID=1348 RepID=UPI000E37B55F|nr:DUF697 domain-containing protein [Streptococcus parauberis]RFE01338.1 hypothetical protein ADO06_01250 [Streptococcus parauberis]